MTARYGPPPDPVTLIATGPDPVAAARARRQRLALWALTAGAAAVAVWLAGHGSRPDT